MTQGKRRTVRAVPGRAVVDPDTGIRIAEEPAAVDDSPFWRRRIRDGDVEEIKPAAPGAETQQPSPSAPSNKRLK